MIYKLLSNHLYYSVLLLLSHSLLHFYIRARANAKTRPAAIASAREAAGEVSSEFIAVPESASVLPASGVADNLMIEISGLAVPPQEIASTSATLVSKLVHS